MRGEQVVLDHDAAVGYAVEEGLGPVPRGMEADGPPERAGAKGRAAGEQATVEYEQDSATKRQNKNRQASETPRQPSEKVGNGARSAETIDRVRAFLDPGHDPSDEQGGEKRDGLADECEGQREFGAGRARIRE